MTLQKLLSSHVGMRYENFCKTVIGAVGRMGVSADEAFYMSLRVGI